jgi:hypothetical protein
VFKYAEVLVVKMDFAVNFFASGIALEFAKYQIIDGFSMEVT